MNLLEEASEWLLDLVLTSGEFLLKKLFLPGILGCILLIAIYPSETSVYLTLFGFYHSLGFIIFLFFMLLLEYAKTEKNYRVLVIKVLLASVLFVLVLWKGDDILGVIGRGYNYLAMRQVEVTVYFLIGLFVLQTSTSDSIDFKRVSYLGLGLGALFKIHLMIPESFSLNDLAQIKLEPNDIKEYMRQIEGIDERGALVYNNEWKGRNEPVMFTWYYKDIDLVGHASLGMTLYDENEGTQFYISHWPLLNSNYTTNLKKSKDTHVGINDRLQSDIKQENGYPDHIIIFKNGVLNEEAIMEWFQSEYLESDEYHLFTSNCINIVRSALRVGGVIKSRERFKFLGSLNKLLSVIHSTKGNAESIIGNLKLHQAPVHWLYIYNSIILVAEFLTLVILLYTAFVALEITYFYYIHNYSFDFVKSYSFLEPKWKSLRKWWIGRANNM